jgi:hypothetical protein
MVPNQPQRDHARCPRMGQTETSARQPGMSGTPIADIVRLHAQVRSVPGAEVSTLFDHLIGARK